MTVLIGSILMACAQECPPGSSRSDDGLCYLDDDTGVFSGDYCAVADGSSGQSVGVESCSGEVCVVASGEFWMGESSAEVPERCPARQVQLSEFAIDQHEVTIDAYDACVAAGGCTARAEPCEAAGEVFEAGEVPATCMTWQQAADYCGWAGGRLPTEAEWEKAARGTEGALWAWGSAPPTCLDANFRFVTTYCSLGLLEVGRYATRSAFGLMDTVGNAWEWTADWYDAGYYRDAPDTDPAGPESCRLLADGAPGECTARVIRGGAYNTVENTVRGTTRGFAVPTITDLNIGVRCAYDR